MMLLSGMGNPRLGKLTQCDKGALCNDHKGEYLGEGYNGVYTEEAI
jgi:hypothetical protein